jgi:hypothetical protein
MKAIYGEAGLATFYTGYWTTVAREIPFSFIQFPIFEGLKKAWRGAAAPSRSRRARSSRLPSPARAPRRPSRQTASEDAPPPAALSTRARAFPPRRHAGVGHHADAGRHLRLDLRRDLVGGDHAARRGQDAHDARQQERRGRARPSDTPERPAPVGGPASMGAPPRRVARGRGACDVGGGSDRSGPGASPRAHARRRPEGVTRLSPCPGEPYVGTLNSLRTIAAEEARRTSPPASPPASPPTRARAPARAPARARARAPAQPPRLQLTRRRSTGRVRRASWPSSRASGRA